MNHENKLKIRINPQDLFRVANWMALQFHYYLFIGCFRALQTCFLLCNSAPAEAFVSRSKHRHSVKILNYISCGGFSVKTRILI